MLAGDIADGTGRQHVEHPKRAFQAAGGAGDHHCSPLSLLDESGDGGLAGVQHASDEDVDRVVPGLHLLCLLTDYGHDPGVGQDDVHAAELSQPLVEDSLHRRHVPYVGFSGNDPSVHGFDLLDRCGEVVLGGSGVGHGGDLVAQIEGDDVRALLSQPNGM
jgi:hypothetical protein